MKLVAQRHISGFAFLLFLLLMVMVAPVAAGRQNSEARSVSSSSTSASYLHLPESWVVESEQQGSEFGLAVAPAGDVNGDGYDDVIVGAPRYDAGVYREGTAFVYYGSTGGLSDNPDWQASSSQTGSRFGSAVAAAGDVNHDGYDDIIVGAYAYNNGQNKVGAFFVFHGSPAGLSLIPDATYIGEQKEAEFGFSVASAGDVNGDDYDDVIIGARWADDDQTNEGITYLYYGSPAGLAPLPGWSAAGDQMGAAFGSAVSPAGDVNGDGYDDIVVGAPYYDGASPDEGAAFVFTGSAAGLSAASSWQTQGDQTEAGLGSAVATVGDVNGDGFADLAVGAPHYSVNRPNEGAVFLYSGSIAGLSTTPARLLTIGQEGSGFGIAVGEAGDINDDGFGDVLVGAYLYTGDQSQEGAIFLYYGAAGGLSGWPFWSAGGNKAETWFGYTAGTAGDVNGDGYSDVMAGAPQYRDEQIIVGRVVGYHGAPGVVGASIFLPLVVYNNP